MDKCYSVLYILDYYSSYLGLRFGVKLKYQTNY